MLIIAAQGGAEDARRLVGPGSVVIGLHEDDRGSSPYITTAYHFG